MVALALALACSPPERSASPADLFDPDRAAAPPPAAADGADVVINELQASNKSTWQDTESWGFPDWIELYNAGTAPADLRDLQVGDSSGNFWHGPDDGQLLPGEVLFLASFGVDSDYNLPFDLSSQGGERVVLTWRGSVVDVVPVGQLGDDLSLARFPDGGAWNPTARPTPGVTNGSKPSDTLDPSDELFKAYAMHEIEIHVDPSLFGSLDSGLPEPGEVTVDGIYFRKVDLKNTGQGSFDQMTGKPRLVINLDAYETDREFLGVDNLELHNGKTADCTRGRDWISYKYAGLGGTPASRVGFAHVTLDGENYGLYVLVENQDDKFIKARFPESAATGMMFEGGDFGGFGLSSMDYESGPQPPDPASVAAMNAADNLASGPSTDQAVSLIWNYLEHDEILNYIAFEGIADNWDGYDSPHNYRWYVDGVTHRTQLVPAGIEITWVGRNPDQGTGDPALWTSNGNLAGWCFDNTGCKRDYAEHVLAMADIVEDNDLADQYEDLTNWLLPYIQADPKKFEDMPTVLGVIAKTLGNIRDNPQQARNDVYAVFPDMQP